MRMRKLASFKEGLNDMENANFQVYRGKHITRGGRHKATCGCGDPGAGRGRRERKGVPTLRVIRIQNAEKITRVEGLVQSTQKRRFMQTASPRLRQQEVSHFLEGRKGLPNCERVSVTLQ